MAVDRGNRITPVRQLSFCGHQRKLKITPRDESRNTMATASIRFGAGGHTEDRLPIQDITHHHRASGDEGA